MSPVLVRYCNSTMKKGKNCENKVKQSLRKFSTNPERKKDFRTNLQSLESFILSTRGNAPYLFFVRKEV